MPKKKNSGPYKKDGTLRLPRGWGTRTLFHYVQKGKLDWINKRYYSV